MNLMGISSIRNKKYKRSINNTFSSKIVPNILNRKFNVSKPNNVWVSDITHVKINNKWHYLSIIMDLFSKKIVGWDLSSSFDKEIVIKAFKKAINRRKTNKNLIFHSDRGVQYASNEFKKNLKNNSIIQSMSRKANCWDNSPAESFFSTIKSELINNKNFICKNEAFRIIFDYIEIFYNNKRLHSSLNFLTPMEVENNYFNNSNKLL